MCANLVRFGCSNHYSVSASVSGGMAVLASGKLIWGMVGVLVSAAIVLGCFCG